MFVLLPPTTALVFLAETPVTVDQLITAGGTAGLIAYLFYTVFQFGSNRWHSHGEMEACEKRVADADKRTEVALAQGVKATASVENLTVELKSYRTMVERLLTERGMKVDPE